MSSLHYGLSMVKPTCQNLVSVLDERAGDDGPKLAFSQRHGLSGYHASYLALAINRQSVGSVGPLTMEVRPEDVGSGHAGPHEGDPTACAFLAFSLCPISAINSGPRANSPARALALSARR